MSRPRKELEGIIQKTYECNKHSDPLFGRQEQRYCIHDALMAPAFCPLCNRVGPGGNVEDTTPPWLEFEYHRDGSVLSTKIFNGGPKTPPLLRIDEDSKHGMPEGHLQYGHGKKDGENPGRSGDEAYDILGECFRLNPDINIGGADYQRWMGEYLKSINGDKK